MAGLCRMRMAHHDPHLPFDPSEYYGSFRSGTAIRAAVSADKFSAIADI
jgi:predicted nucleotidyltransferase